MSRNKETAARRPDLGGRSTVFGTRGRSPVSTRAPPLSASASSIVEGQPPTRVSPWPLRWPFSHRCRLAWGATPSCCCTKSQRGRVIGVMAQVGPGAAASPSSPIWARCRSAAHGYGPGRCQVVGGRCEPLWEQASGASARASLGARGEWLPCRRGRCPLLG